MDLGHCLCALKSSGSPISAALVGMGFPHGTLFGNMGAPQRYCRFNLRLGWRQWGDDWLKNGIELIGSNSGKESTCQCRRHKRHEFNPWVGKIPWRRAWQPTPIFLPILVKNLPANAGDIRDMSSVPGLGRSPGGGHGNPLQYSCHGIRRESHGQSSLMGYSLWGREESDTTAHAHTCMTWVVTANLCPVRDS